MLNLKVVVEKISQETYDVKKYALRFEDKAVFDFKPGQFIMLHVPVIKDGKRQILKRAYSIASTPSKKGRIELLIQKAGIVTSELDTYNGGEVLELSGPFGEFTFSKGEAGSIMGIATGVGIAPIWSIFQYIMEEGMPVNLTLLFSNKTPHDFILKEPLESMQQSLKGFKMVLSITRPHASSMQEMAAWKHKTGRINKSMIEQLIKSERPELFYVCGLPEMVNDAVRHLMKLGIEKSRIKIERF